MTTMMTTSHFGKMSKYKQGIRYTRPTAKFLNEVSDLVKEVFMRGTSYSRILEILNNAARFHHNHQLANCSTCCGVSELTRLDDIPFDDLARAVASSLRPYCALLYYSVDPPVTRKLKSFGFKELARFYNGNSGNTVVILFFYPWRMK